VASTFPRCIHCRVKIDPGVKVVFQDDGRVHHVECPRVTCSECSRDIVRDTPIRRQGEMLFHSTCWMKRLRARLCAGATVVVSAAVGKRTTRGAQYDHFVAERLDEWWSFIEALASTPVWITG
jgi:hypothetical protein